MDFVFARLILSQQSDTSAIFELVAESRGVVLLVLLLLIAFSVACWGIIAYKWLVLSKAQRQSIHFLDLFWGSKRLDNIFKQAESFPRSPTAQVFRAGYIEWNKIQRQASADQSTMSQALGGLENIQRAMRRAANTEMSYLERYTAFLATTASAAPFVGLFGTVWGIMKSFIGIKHAGTAGLNVVAPGIAEALIATAVGLAAAIPAVIAYNFFLSKIRSLDGEIDNFSNDFLNIIKRHFMKS
ncbi:MAG: protein TolQ [Myxococcota bacterium]